MSDKMAQALFESQKNFTKVCEILEKVHTTIARQQSEIEAHEKEILKLKDYVTVLNLNYGHLQRKFKALTGKE